MKNGKEIRRAGGSKTTKWSQPGSREAALRGLRGVPKESAVPPIHSLDMSTGIPENFSGIFPANFLTENSEETTGPKGRRGTAGFPEVPGFPANIAMTTRAASVQSGQYHPCVAAVTRQS
jgi:hypothetical protein